MLKKKKTALDNTETNECDCVPQNLYLLKQAMAIVDSWSRFQDP